MVLVGIWSVVALNKMKDTNVVPLENGWKINGSVRKVVLRPKIERNLIAQMEKCRKNGSHAGFKPEMGRINPCKKHKILQSRKTIHFLVFVFMWIWKYENTVVSRFIYWHNLSFLWDHSVSIFAKYSEIWAAYSC